MASNSVYREKSLDRISSPERLDDYIKVSNPSVWVIIFALFILIGGFMYWGFFGSLPTTVTGAGVTATESVKNKNVVTSFISQEDYDKLQSVSASGKNALSSLDVKVRPRNAAEGTEYKGKIQSVDGKALDENAIAKVLENASIDGNEAIASLLTPSDGFGVKVMIALDEATLTKNAVCDVTIVVQQDTPKDFLFS